MKVTVENYSEQWPVRFERVAHDLQSALGDLPDTSIEHVGSTSVPRLAAKPILDVDVITSEEHLPAAIRLLEHAGYKSLGEQGIEGRVALASPDDEPRRHVYVCLSDSIAVKNHLAVRDVLRTSNELRDAYGRLKLELSKRDFENMDEYVFAKTSLLQEILKQSGLSADDLAAIRQANSE